LLKLNLERTFILVFGAMMLLGMHYFQHNQGGTGLELPFNLVVWIFGSILIGLGLIKVSQAENLRYHKPLLVLLLATLTLYLPLFYPNAEFAEFALDRLIALAAGVLLIFSFTQLNLGKQQWQQLLYLILVGVLIESSYALVQMYLLTEGNWVGFNIYSQRAAGIFQQPNVLGSFVLFGPLCAAWLIAEQAVRNKYQLGLICLTSFLGAWTCFLTGSRTTLVSFFVILPLLAPYLYKKAQVTVLRYWYLSLAVGVIAYSLPELFNSNSIPREVVGGDSTVYRITMLEVCWQLFKQQPFWGWGYGGFDGVYHEAQALFNQQDLVNGFHFNVAHPHNELAYWAVEGGLLPLITLLFLAGYILKQLFNKRWEKGCFYLAMLFPYIFHSMTELPFYHSAILWLLFCLFIAEINLRLSPAQNRSFPAKFAPKVFGLLIPIVTFIFMLTGLQSINKVTQFERSGSTNVQLLEEIINPVPILGRYEFDAMTFRLNAALSLKLEAELENYLNWSDKVIRQKTRTELYLNRYLALQVLGLTSQADELYQHALELYPDDQRLSFRYIHATNHGEQGLQDYLVWNQRALAENPSPYLYVHKINALVGLQEIKKAVETFIEAKQHFPNDISLKALPRLKPYVIIKQDA